MGHGRRGITLVELLVVIAVIGVLTAWLLPAVLSAHEAVRQLRCVNNLKQIGLALEGYVSAYGTLSPAGVGVGDGRGCEPVNDHSMKARLLGFMERQPLFDAINFSLPMNPYVADGPYFDNVTVASTRLGLLLCPSDVNPAIGTDFAALGGAAFTVASTNYPNNMGVTPTYTGKVLNGPAYLLNEAHRSRQVLGLAEVTDGASNTAMFSEFVKGAGSGAAGSGSPRGTSFHIPWETKTGTPWGDSRVCQHATQVQGHYQGEFWTHHHPARGGGYFHTNPPNSKSCNGGYFPSGWVTASSFHPGGVNVLFLDGSVKFIKNTINYQAWTAIGTMAGGEVVSADSL